MPSQSFDWFVIELQRWSSIWVCPGVLNGSDLIVRYNTFDAGIMVQFHT